MSLAAGQDIGNVKSFVELSVSEMFLLTKLASE